MKNSKYIYFFVIFLSLFLNIYQYLLNQSKVEFERISNKPVTQSFKRLEIPSVNLQKTISQNDPNNKKLLIPDYDKRKNKFYESLRDYIINELYLDEHSYYLILGSIKNIEESLDQYYRKQTSVIEDEYGRSNGYIPTPQDYLFSYKIYTRERERLQEKLGKTKLKEILKYIRDHNYLVDGSLPVSL